HFSPLPHRNSAGRFTSGSSHNQDKAALTLCADFVAKVPKYQAMIFERKEAKLSSPINMAPRPSAKSPVSFSLGDEVPHIFIRESHQRPRKILISGGKRLF